MAYTTIQAAKDYLGITTTTDDSLIGGFISSAQAWIDRHCHRTFEATADTERTFDALYDVIGDALVLDRDLASITSITNGDGTVLTAAQYVTEPRNAVVDGLPIQEIRIRSDAGITWTYGDYHENAITVDGPWAYSLSVPYDVEQACMRLTAWLYRQRENRTGDDDRTVIAGNATILPTTMPSDAAAYLKPYRRKQ